MKANSLQHLAGLECVVMQFIWQTVVNAKSGRSVGLRELCQTEVRCHLCRNCNRAKIVTAKPQTPMPRFTH